MKDRVRALVLCVTLVLSACGGDAPTTAPTDVDRQFVADMIPHHHLGMELIDQATRRVDDTRVRRLVFEMSTYHQSELDQLHEWAREWNVVPVDDFPGRIETDQLSDLAALSGVDYDRRWLELMIEHHEGAIEIAEHQMDAGSYDDAIGMAQSVREVQTKDIEEMSSLLGALEPNK